MTGRLLQRIDDGWTLVTAGARLARRLRYLYARNCIGHGRRTWETPDILPFDAWLERCWREPLDGAADAPRLLNRVQCEALWLDVVANSHFRSRLLQPAAVAREAAHAWNTLQLWCAPPLPDDSQLNDDGRAFAAWMRAFRERCAAGGWIDPASLGSALRARWQGGQAPAPGHIAFIGFDAPMPVQQALVAALRGADWNAEWFAAEPGAAQPVAIGFADRRAETAATAAWVRDALGGDAPPSIGIVVPDLRSRRKMIEDIFDDAFDPGALRLRENAAGRAYNIAQGEPLADQPLVTAALAVLSLGRRRFALGTAEVLLRTPFLMRSAGEMPELARLGRVLRRHGEARLDLRSLLRVAEAPARRGDAIPAIAGRLRRVADVFGALPSRQSPRGWAAAFSKILVASGWPGWRPLDSGEYQAAEAWRETLDEFAALDVFGEVWEFDAALSTLTRLAEADFQPRTGEAPVEVLSMEGAADMGFDRLWVMGLEESAWPPAARPSPFLPMRMQRELEMPFATPGIALRSARLLTQKLAASANTVIFSYPENDAETPLRPSPLIRAWRNADVAPIGPGPDYLRQIFAIRSLEDFDDARATEIAPDRPVRGGATLLRDQAACPFRAFARHRLGARSMDPVDIGLDAGERGSLVHAVLESVWAALRDHAALAAAGETELDAIVAAAAERAVEEMRLRRPITITPRFAEVEKARLRGLVRDWLQLERGRAPFTVEAREQAREAPIGGLQLRLRVDRIDRLADGRALILDYKTGEARPADWLGRRPDAPQLPLYAVTADEPIAGLAFARISPGAHAFVGSGESADLLPGLSDPAVFERSTGVRTWPELLAVWRRELEALASGFLNGRAEVDPKTPQSCRECDLHAFCRVHESRPWSGDVDE